MKWSRKSSYKRAAAVNSTIDWLAKCVSEAEQLPLETRQQFLDLMRAGKSLGEAREEAGITFDAANGIMHQNITAVHTLRPKAL